MDKAISASTVEWLTAIGTIGAVFVALFGNWIQNKFYRPILKIELASETGERISTSHPEHNMKDGNERIVYWYVVRVSNGRKRRWPAAREVRVHLVQLDQSQPNGDFRTIWAAEVPISWRHTEAYPPARTIGPDADYNLCSVADGELSIYPLIHPKNLPIKWNGKTRIRLKLQARSIEVDSKVYSFDIEWDGVWVDDASEMRKHLRIQDITASVGPRN